MNDPEMKFWVVRAAEEKTPDWHKYATFWGVFFNFLWAKKIQNFSNNVLASALKN